MKARPWRAEYVERCPFGSEGGSWKHSELVFYVELEHEMRRASGVISGNVNGLGKRNGGIILTGGPVDDGIFKTP